MTMEAPHPPKSDVEDTLMRASAAATEWARCSASERARVLVTIADHLDDDADALIATAAAETHLTLPRLRNELLRTSFQLRFFADIVLTGAHLDACVDHADTAWGMGPRPDIRRVLEPLGPVLVFSASNFPFAFSVAGGDTASALAAGCPVVVKAHSGHLRLSEQTGAVVERAVAMAGGPEGLVTVITGTEAGRQALQDRRIRAASFTGSIPGGRALFDVANARPDPIPFYGELGSVNPAFVTRSAASARAEEIASGFIESFTLGAGQFCTKPGILFTPRDSDVIERLMTAGYPAPAPLLNDRIQVGFTDALTELLANAAVTPLVIDDDSHADPPTPTLARTSIEALLASPGDLVLEVFGPAALVVEYDDESQLLAVAETLDGQLTATIHGNDDDVIAPRLIRILAGKAGRVVWNQWPTGVTVTHAQQHGGPYPATTSPTSTSVGGAALQRFVRPVAYQGLPDHLLPAALRDANPLGIVRRVNG